MISRPDFTPSDWEYRFVWEEGVSVVLDRFHESRGTLECEITIDKVAGAGAGRLHGPAKLNLTADRTLGMLGNKLRPRVELDWDGLFTQVQAIAIRQYREGSPLIDLAEVVPGERSRYLLEPFIDQHGVSTLVADGGTGKSLTALSMAVAIATGEPFFGEYPEERGAVVYLDWEADEETHAERLRAVCTGMNVEVPKGMIHYQRMVASLHESVATMRKKVASVAATLVVVDSVGMARGGAPESAEETIRLFVALRSLNLPILAVDHISKESKKSDNKDGSDPIGSVYTRNSSRLVWSLEGSQIEGRDETVLLFKNTKANFGRKELARSFRYKFRTGPGERLESVTITAENWKEAAEFAERVPVKDRILKVLRDGKMSTAAVAEALGVTEGVARVRLNELRKAGKAMKLGDDWGISYFEDTPF